MARATRSGLTLSWRRFPWVTIAIAATGAVASLLPTAGEALEFVRGGAGAGWRLVTSQFAHWSAPMAVVDLGALAIAGAALEFRSRTAAVLALAGAVAAVALAIDASPAVSRYRGSSGIGMALVAALGVHVLALGPRLPARLLGATALALVAAKLGWESGHGASFWPGSLPEGVRLLVPAHAAGAAAGVLAAGLTSFAQRAISARAARRAGSPRD